MYYNILEILGLHVALHGDAKKAQPSKEGYYILQTDLVNERPCWFQENGENAIWHRNSGIWYIGSKGDLRSNRVGDIYSSHYVKDPFQVPTWRYYHNGAFSQSKDIIVTRSGNTYIDLVSNFLPYWH